MPIVRLLACLSLVALSRCGTDTVSSELPCEILLPGDTCTAFCDRVITDCNQIPSLGREACLQFCECDLVKTAEDSEACAEATEAVFVCVSGLDCLEVSDWFERTPENAFPCFESTQESTSVCEQLPPP